MRRHALLFCCVPALLACLWDYDTLMQERSRFPKALELITGKYLRHSPEFYQWRIDDRLKKLQGDPNNLAWLDDLGVAYSKVGQLDKAIETMERKERIKSDQYETAANLGTFYIYAGRLEDARKEIEKALKINPDAHFGREKYQLALVKYIQERRAAGVKGLPLSRLDDRENLKGLSGFGLRAVPKECNTPQDEQKNALKGVMGMMRAGHHEMPILLECLGDLMYRGYPGSDGKQLSARAYLKASYAVSNDEAAEYRKLAVRSLEMARLDMEKLELEFKQELAEADDWYAELKEKELGWIRDGKNPEEEFEKLYKADPEIETGVPTTLDKAKHVGTLAGLALLGFGILGVLGYGCWKLAKGLWWMAG